jgi:hypothetical protein
LWRDGIYYFDIETRTVDAIIVNTTWSKEHHSRSTHAVQYKYSFNDQEYLGVEKIAFNRYAFAKGDTILIQVLKRKPEISNIAFKDSSQI